MTAALAGMAAFGLSALLTESARRWAFRHGLADRPAAHKAHRRPTPYLGGVAIVVGTVLGAAGPIVFGSDPLTRVVGLCVAGGVGVATLGLIDDVRGLTAATRLAVEAVVATWVALNGVRLDLVGPQWLDVALTVVWIIVITNSFNLLDNTDGALATVSIATCVLLAVSGLDRQPAALLICLAAASAGFLLHNRPPARIFMGDAGSLFVGFLLATGVLLVRSPVGGYGHVAALLLAVFVSIVDTSLVVIARRRQGRSIFQGGTDHAAHRLARIGLAPYPVLGVLLAGVTGPGLVGALVRAGRLPGQLALVGTGAGAALAVALLLRIPGYPVRPGGPAPTLDHQPMRHSRIQS